MLHLIRRDLEAFKREYERERYLVQSGRKTVSESAAIDDAFPRLSDAEALSAVLQAQESATDPEERARLRTLREFLTLHRLDHHVRPAADRLASREIALTAPIPDHAHLSWRSAMAKVSTVRDREERGGLAEKIVAGARETNPLRVEIHRGLHGGVKALGFAGYRDLIDQVTGLPLDALHKEWLGFLRSTEDVYREHLSWFLRRTLGIPAGEARRDDLLHLFFALDQRHAVHFPAEALIPRTGSMLAGMGLDLWCAGRVISDIDPLPLKSPRGFCAPVGVPDEVYLVLRPTAGVQDTQTFLHEAGHAMHFASADPKLPVEERRLGDFSLTEGYAITFDRLLLNPEWVRRIAQHPRPKEFLREHAFYALYLLRRYAAKLAYEIELHSDADPEGKGELYADWMRLASGVAFPSGMYLYDVDRHFYSARYLRAWMMEAALGSHLTRQFGDDWFRNPQTGPFLRLLWSTGQRETPETLAERLGIGSLSAEAAAGRLRPFLD